MRGEVIVGELFACSAPESAHLASQALRKGAKNRFSFAQSCGHVLKDTISRRYRVVVFCGPVPVGL
jgi:hypothetical protein